MAGIDYDAIFTISQMDNIRAFLQRGLTKEGEIFHMVNVKLHAIYFICLTY